MKFFFMWGGGQKYNRIWKMGEELSKNQEKCGCYIGNGWHLICLFVITQVFNYFFSIVIVTVIKYNFVAVIVTVFKYFFGAVIVTVIKYYLSHVTVLVFSYNFLTLCNCLKITITKFNQAKLFQIRKTLCSISEV